MDLRCFLGSVNFYRRHIKNAAANQALLHELLHGAKKKDMSPIAWNGQSTAAFLQCKQDTPHSQPTHMQTPSYTYVPMLQAQPWALLLSNW